MELVDVGRMFEIFAEDTRELRALENCEDVAGVCAREDVKLAWKRTKGCLDCVADCDDIIVEDQPGCSEINGKNASQCKISTIQVNWTSSVENEIVNHY